MGFHDWKLGTWNCKSLKFDRRIRILFDILSVTRGVKQSTRAVARNNKLETAFYVLGGMKELVVSWDPRTERTDR